DGAYCWTTHTECAGLASGESRVRFVYLPKRRRNEKGEDLFKGKYNDPNNLTHTLKVADEEQTDVNYDLKTE
ncbi:MAG: hypothetical protein JSS02_17240, partial [Planctomycetes bacterium]|nr:hypothetical protein [Planctomycetota bacterium]